MIGEKLKELRKEKGITQMELANILGIKKITYFKYESEEISIPLPKLLEISNYFNVTPNDLLGFKKEIGMFDKKDFYKECFSENKRTTFVAVEKGDKYSNFYLPILKNSLDDVVVLDINGNLFRETEKYRSLCFGSDIKRIDLFEEKSISFNPLSYIDIKNVDYFAEILAINSLGEKGRTDKTKFLTSVIKYLFFKSRTEEIEDYDFNFDLVLNYIKDLGEVKGITMSEEFKIFNGHKYFNKEQDKFLFEEVGILKKEKENTNEEKELIEKGKIPQCYYENLELIQLGDEKLKEIKKEIISTLFVFFNPRVNQNTKKDELNLEEIKTKNDEKITTVYFIVDEDKLDKLLPIIRMFYAIIFEKYTRNYNYKEKFSKKDKRKEEKRTILMLENLGKINLPIFMLDDNINHLSGYGVDFFIVTVSEEAESEDITNLSNMPEILNDCNYMEISEKKLEFIFKKMGLGKFKITFSNGNIEKKEIK